MDAPWIVHLDVDAFFASVEQILDPDLRGRPVIVGGGVGGRGVVASASYEARRRGVATAMPIARAREVCPQGVFLAPKFPEYNRFSEKLFQLLCSVSPVVEQSSLDDAYVDLDGCRRLYGTWSARPLGRLPFLKEGEGIYRRSEKTALPPRQRAPAPDSCRWAAAVGLWIKRIVRAETGLDVSVGLGTNKAVAKMASEFGKPDGIVLVEPGHEAEFLGMLELKDIPGVGRVTREKFRKWNVHTVQEARRLPRGLLEDAFGQYRGKAVYRLLRGQMWDGAEGLDPGGPPRSLTRETTFWSPSSDFEFVRSMLFYLTERLGRALRRRGLKGRTVQLKLRYQNSGSIRCSRSLGRYTDSDEEVYEAAHRLLRLRWCRSRRLRTVGVGLTKLCESSGHQRELFDSEQERGRRLDRCLDRLRERFGFDVVRRGPTIELACSADHERAELPAPARR